MRIAEEFDPNFDIDRVVFTARDFVKKAWNLSPESWLLFDEPGVTLSHRTWQSEANRVTAWFLQSSRYRRVNALFALPSLNLMDIAARTILTFQAIMVDRGFARLYRIVRNQFGSNPDFYTPRLGVVKAGLPSKKLRDQYEERRREWHQSFFKEKESDEPRPAPESTTDLILKAVRKDPAAYVDSKGRLSLQKIIGRHQVSYTTASKIRVIVEGAKPKNEQADTVSPSAVPA